MHAVTQKRTLVDVLLNHGDACVFHIIGVGTSGQGVPPVFGVTP